VKREKNEFFVYFDGNNSKYEDGSIVINLSKIHFFHFTPKTASPGVSLLRLCVRACLLSVSFRYTNWHFKIEQRALSSEQRAQSKENEILSACRRLFWVLFSRDPLEYPHPVQGFFRNTKTRRQAKPIQSVTETKVKQSIW